MVKNHNHCCVWQLRHVFTRRNFLEKDARCYGHCPQFTVWSELENRVPDTALPMHWTWEHCSGLWCEFLPNPIIESGLKCELIYLHDERTDIHTQRVCLIPVKYIQPVEIIYLDVAINLTLIMLHTFSPGDYIKVIFFNSVITTSLEEAFLINLSHNSFNPVRHLGLLLRFTCEYVGTIYYTWGIIIKENII